MQDNKQVIIAADCTGHGVPGAFMSMLGVSFLNEIILNKGVIQPDLILNNLRDDVIRSLKQTKDDGGVKDGMDMCVCLLDMENKSLQFGLSICLSIHKDVKVYSCKNGGTVYRIGLCKNT